MWIELARSSNPYALSVYIYFPYNCGGSDTTTQKKETVAVLKGSVHLCRCIFSSATDLPEFQRQVAVPNVPKFIAAMIALLEADCDAELKVS